ncbi:MAG: ATP-dependent DNA ligase, partial [Verrucomicrobiota bacterium]
MQRFTKLYLDLDASNRTTSKLAALKRYFIDVPHEDGAWAVFFLTGNRLKQPVPSKLFREWGSEACGFPEWMLDECYDHVGDLAETLTLLIAGPRKENSGVFDKPLHQIVEEVILPLRDMEPAAQRDRLTEVWAAMDSASCFLFNKLITG